MYLIRLLSLAMAFAGESGAQLTVGKQTTDPMEMPYASQNCRMFHMDASHRPAAWQHGLMVSQFPRSFPDRRQLYACTVHVHG